MWSLPERNINDQVSVNQVCGGDWKCMRRRAVLRRNGNAGAIVSRGRSSWKGILEAEGNVVREEGRDGRAPDVECH